MSCPLCKDGPGDFVVGMMLGYAWGQVVVPDLPNLDLEASEVQKLLGHLVWHAAKPICLNDFLVGVIEVKESGVTATIDLEGGVSEVGLKEFYEVQEMIGAPKIIPLPDGVWDALKKLNDTSSAGISMVR